MHKHAVITSRIPVNPPVVSCSPSLLRIFSFLGLPDLLYVVFGEVNGSPLLPCQRPLLSPATWIVSWSADSIQIFFIVHRRLKPTSVCCLLHEQHFMVRVVRFIVLLNVSDTQLHHLV